MTELNEAYMEMITAFDASQDILNNYFIADVDFNHQLTGVRETFDSQTRISYFSDFIFIQQMMTLEIDIILGVTNTLFKRRDQSQVESVTSNFKRKDL